MSDSCQLLIPTEKDLNLLKEVKTYLENEQNGGRRNNRQTGGATWKQHAYAAVIWAIVNGMTLAGIMLLMTSYAEQFQVTQPCQGWQGQFGGLLPGNLSCIERQQIFDRQVFYFRGIFGTASAASYSAILAWVVSHSGSDSCDDKLPDYYPPVKGGKRKRKNTTKTRKSRKSRKSRK